MRSQAKWTPAITQAEVSMKARERLCHNPAMKRLVATEPGGLERLSVIEGPTPSPGPKEVLVAIAYSGVNFIDVYFRNGLYKSDTPIALGSEGAGVVEQVGTDVTDLQPGDRVVYAMHRGSHAEYAAVPA